MKHPFIGQAGSGLDVWTIRYPGVGATSPFELYSPDTLASLARRILISEANSSDRELFVSDAEVARVVALNHDKALPAPVMNRLGQMGAGQTRKPKGRKGAYPGALGGLWMRLDEEKERDFYYRAKARLKALQAANRLGPWRGRQGYGDDCGALSDAAAEHTRRVFHPEISRRRLMNRLFSRKHNA